MINEFILIFITLSEMKQSKVDNITFNSKESCNSTLVILDDEFKRKMKLPFTISGNSPSSYNYVLKCVKK